MIFFEIHIEFVDFFLLFDGWLTGENSLFFFVSEGSPECHNRVSFIFVDESLLMHDDVGDFFEIDTQEMDKFLRFHIFGDTGKSGDIREETRDGLSFSSELHFFIVFEDTYDEIFCEVLRESATEKALSFFFPDILVPGDENSHEEDDHHEFDRVGEEFMKCGKIEDLSEEEDDEPDERRNELVDAIFREEREKCQEKRESDDDEHFCIFFYLDDVRAIEDRIDHIGMDVDTVLDSERSVKFIVQSRRGWPNEDEFIFYHIWFVGSIVGIHKRNLPETRGFRYIVDVHIARFLRCKRDEFISEDITFESIYVGDILGINEGFLPIDDVEVFPNDTERKSFPGCFSLSIHRDDTVYCGIVFIDFGMEVPNG
ncbi:MAG: hypothetical protein ACD_78C00280G0002 [uncultured bacterium (gcode 4)]|uniref:Uncharacterized protein n=1 Tax=uncultured bacterium (gcode 4) TaxID=1234023 RepID=K1YBQ6_9BACT|nr:MAG: hypothetical protein ACD_78C00280G0002 [uncultured bacterium (gcode 4)]